ncbi:Neurotransmitter-gated ion-channel ligand binding domain family protein [Brugia pahangi]
MNDNGTIEESDQKPLWINEVINNDPSDNVIERNVSANLFAKGNEFDANNDNENSITKLLRSNLIDSKNNSGDNFTERAVNEESEISGTFSSLDHDNSIENEKNTSEIYDYDSTDTKPILWINTTYQAYDIGLNVTTMVECAVWNVSMLMNITDTSENQMNVTDGGDPSWTISGIEIINTKERLEELKLDTNLLDQYRKIMIVFEEICKNYPRELWFSTVEDARQLGITKTDSFICDPFKEELHPSEEKLQQFEQLLNEIVHNTTTILNELSTISNDNITFETVTPITLSKNKSTEKEYQLGKRSLVRYLRETSQKDSGSDESDEFLNLASVDSKDDSEYLDKDSWTDTQEDSDEVIKKENQAASDDRKGLKAPVVIKIDAGQQQARLIINKWEAVQALRLNIAKHVFKRHQLIGLFLDGICADFVPSAVDEFNATEFEGVDIEGPIGLNITTLSLSGVNLTELAEKLRNDTEVDMILNRTMSENGTLGGSFILPVLQKNKYDPFSAPIVFQGSAVVVRFGIYIESMSNFQTSTMDYDMDIFLMMAWRDARLVNPYEKAILVKEEEILEKIWRPDPFFANAKEASFHEVTFLNFLMRIYNDGLVLYETRIKLKPSCNLVLCKYPHDRQTCELKIKSFAYPTKTVRFEWFSNKRDAIDKNPDVTLPELYIHRYEPTYCERTRKSGHFSCLKAIFRLKRDVGFHIAQTYIPTSLALMFSWVGVWLPEEFMEGRIGVAITVLLTLSTESAGAREHLPSVSYMKAIDLWFGFITAFVFITLLQTLIVIALDKRAKQLRKSAAKKKSELTEQSRELMLARAEQYHKRGRYLDNFCRLFYPLGFLIFLIAYYFVFTEGRQNDCVVTGRQT